MKRKRKGDNVIKYFNGCLPELAGAEYGELLTRREATVFNLTD